MKKIIFLLSVILIFTYVDVFAKTSLIPIDAVFVVDVSLSMRTADPDGISRAAMNLFTDMLQEGRDRVGVVAYAGGVERRLELFEINTLEDREFVRDFINGLDYASWTDHGLGLLEAVNFFAESDETRQGIIIFLTDGNMNVNPSASRTNDNAQSDVNTAISLARERNIPIHTIGLNFDGNLALDYINNISRETYGLSFETEYATNIIDIIDAFFNEMIAAPQTAVEPPVEEIEEQNIVKEKIAYVNMKAFEFYTLSGNIIIPVVSAVIFLFLVLLYMKFLSPKRVFTGKLMIEVVDLRNSKISAPRRLNLIEYGNRVSLAKLVGGEAPPALDSVILMPSPSAPSHLPQLEIKCKNPAVKFTKDFLQRDISNGYSFGSGTEATIEPETDGLQIKLRYVA